MCLFVNKLRIWSLLEREPGVPVYHGYCFPPEAQLSDESKDEHLESKFGCTKNDM